MSSDETPSLDDRLARLGLTGGPVPTDRLSSATAALACIPMYMVANVHAWTADRQFKVPLIDLPGSEQIRESFTIGREEAQLDITPAHREALGTLLKATRPADRIIYEYALDALRLLLAKASPDLAHTVRVAVGRTVVAVARASGKGPLGSGPKITPEERACIAAIAAALDLHREPEAASALAQLEEP